MMKRSKLPRKPLKAKKGTLKRGKLPQRRISGRKAKKNGVPTWLLCVPEGSHGSGSLQKRLWRLKSDFVRIRDYMAFGTFIDSGEEMEKWQHAQAGHWRSYAECNGMFKFHEMNIHAQTPMGNKAPTSTTWENYRKNLVKRYNEEFVLAIDTSNKKWPLKITTELVLREIERTIKMLGMMEIKPPYWNKLMEYRDARVQANYMEDNGYNY